MSKCISGISPRPAIALVRALTVYWVFIFPEARRELRRWARCAAKVPDPVLRGHAAAKLRKEHLSAEGAAAFAILASSRQRKHVVRLCVAFEVMYDLLDAIGEQPVTDVLANNRQLHRALTDALCPPVTASDYYAFHPSRDDGGYLDQLITRCQREMLHLPARHVVRAALARSAVRAGEAQSLNHAGLRQGDASLTTSADAHIGSDTDLYWWEGAAAAGSPLGIFALVAAASHPRTTAQIAQGIESAYFPWIAALHWLLDSLVDHEDDTETGNSSYISHYDSPQHARDRLGTISRRATADTRCLPHADRHAVLLAGMVALNVSHDGASTDAATSAIERVVDELQGPIAPLLLALRLRRRIARLSART